MLQRIIGRQAGAALSSFGGNFPAIGRVALHNGAGLPEWEAIKHVLAVMQRRID
ncbi:hypothetical protein [Maricaulis salignorans]|uniref:hypothetical protein n=1 Tax=Maricaulis salignorans TaxID=144026 RepID=UPI003A91195B